MQCLPEIVTNDADVPEAASGYGDLYVACQLIVEDLHSKVLSSAAAAKRPAFAAKGVVTYDDDYAIDQTFAAVLNTVHSCLPQLRTVLDTAHTSHGATLDGGSVVNDFSRSVWRAYVAEDPDDPELTQADRPVRSSHRG